MSYKLTNSLNHFPIKYILWVWVHNFQSHHDYCRASRPNSVTVDRNPRRKQDPICFNTIIWVRNVPYGKRTSRQPGIETL